MKKKKKKKKSWGGERKRNLKNDARLLQLFSHGILVNLDFGHLYFGSIPSSLFYLIFVNALTIKGFFLKAYW